MRSHCGGGNVLAALERLALWGVEGVLLSPGTDPEAARLLPVDGVGGGGGVVEEAKVPFLHCLCYLGFQRRCSAVDFISFPLSQCLFDLHNSEFFC